MDWQKRANIKPGMRVRIVLKQDQSSGKLTEGIVKDILTNSTSHPHGFNFFAEPAGLEDWAVTFGYYVYPNYRSGIDIGLGPLRRQYVKDQIADLR